MDADAIPAMLAALPPASTIQRRPGAAAILRSLVAEDDLDAVDEWVASVGGAIRRTPPIRSETRGREGMSAQTTPGERYYLVPAVALRPGP